MSLKNVETKPSLVVEELPIEELANIHLEAGSKDDYWFLGSAGSLNKLARIQFPSKFPREFYLLKALPL